MDDGSRHPAGRAATLGTITLAFALAAPARALSPVPIWTGEGNQANAHYGSSVCCAGDVDGDGYSDLIVGAPQYHAPESSEGRAFLIRGTSGGLSPTPSWTAESDQVLAFFGTSVAAAGDVNGDGYADVIVGAPSWDGALSNEGAAFLYLGGPAGLSPTPAWMREGHQAACAFGGAVASAGDVNGDGYDDILVGARGWDAAFNAGGRAFLFLGGPAGPDTTADWTVDGDQVDAALGYSLASAGDVNGDGYADVIVGAFFRDAPLTDEGSAFVYLGGPSGLSTTPVWVGKGNQAGANFGWSVAGAGDVNGDGYSDVIVGARQYDGAFTDEGRAFVYYGSPAGVDSTAAWHVDGGQAGALFGWSVATAGDVNGDGFADVIVGAYKEDATWVDEGQARVYLGSANGLSTTPVWTAVPAQASAQYGWSVSGAGDVNGDGFSDVCVGAPFYDAGQADEGAAFVYLGGAELPLAAPTWRASGGTSALAFGSTVAAGGDVDGDGTSDLLVADPLATSGGIEGLAELFLGATPFPDTSPAWVEGGAPGEGWARALAFAGDVNGDGFDDVLVGAPFRTSDFATEGRAVLYQGSSLGLSPTPSWSVLGAEYDAELGSAVASAGDVNGDGFGDAVVGAPGADEARVYAGRASSPPLVLHRTLHGAESGARFGESVASAGDVNRDGFSDVIVGEPNASAGGFERGRAQLFLGGSGGLSTSAAWTFVSAQDEAHLGAVVAPAGDVDGDGYSDVLVLAPDFDGTYTDEGQALLFRGGPAGLAASPAWTWSPGQASARTDAACALGDVNGDGYGDVLVGASSFTGTHTLEGKAALFLGSATGLGAAPGRTWLGGATLARLGGSLAGRGDVDGDGFPELFLGARGFADATSSGGAAFLVLPNGGGGVTRAFGQRRANGTPIALLGTTDDPHGFRLAALGRSAAGRTRVAVEWEAERLGTAFGDAGVVRGSFHDTGAPVPGVGSAVSLAASVSGLATNDPYRWRARQRSRSPFFPTMPWITPVGNAAGETDLRTAATPSAVIETRVPSQPDLQVLPTPFEDVAIARFALREPAPVRLAVYDVAGRLVRALLDGSAGAGETRVLWDGRDSRGRVVAPGVYFVRLFSPAERLVARVVRVR
ncbi:MAG: FG-GAP-like repeat-containing protein [bacterium]